MSDKVKSQVSEKNKKNEILDAYNELLEKINTEKQLSLSDEKKLKEKQAVVAKVETFSREVISKAIMELKLSLVNELDSLEHKIAFEHQRFTDIQNAVEIESHHLQDLYEMKHNADSLAALLMAQKESRQKFDEEMKQKKMQLTEEAETFRRALEEKKNETEKERTRDEEEYDYNLKLRRKKDKDDYEERKALLERELVERREYVEQELAQRESIIKSQEQEFNSMKKQIELFPRELEKAVEHAQKTMSDTIESKYMYQIELSNKEVQGEQRLHEQLIKSLREKITEQDELIKQLTQKANESTKQVQAIALKALEGGTMRFSSGYSEDGKKTHTSQV